MLWFKFRWILTFSHGLCVKIIRGGNEVKELTQEVDRLFKRPMRPLVVKGILGRLFKMVDIMDDIIFSASALLYREEKDLIEFSDRAQIAAERLIERLGREKGKYKKDIRKLKSM